jgi:hypothetical protein
MHPDTRHRIDMDHAHVTFGLVHRKVSWCVRNCSGGNPGEGWLA